MTLWSYSSSLEESPTPESSSEAAELSFSFRFLGCGFLLFRSGNGGTLVSGWRLASERSGFSFFPPVALSSLSPPSFATKYNSSSGFSAAQPLQGNGYTALVPGSPPPPLPPLSLLPPQEPRYKVNLISSVDNWGQGPGQF